MHPILTVKCLTKDELFTTINQIAELNKQMTMTPAEGGGWLINYTSGPAERKAS